jgi:DNA-binding MarR family transcriptional regulator
MYGTITKHLTDLNFSITRVAISDALDVTLEEMQVLALLKADGKLTQKNLAEKIGKSDRTVKRITVALEEKGLIERIGSKRFGCWKVNINS